MKDNYLLDLAIEDEAMGFSYHKNPYDKNIFKQLISEVNNQNNTNIKYLAQFDFLKIENINDIIMKYIYEFQSAHIKIILLKQLIMNNVEDKEDLLISFFNDFRNSKEYISEIGEPSPSHIYNIYDNLFNSFNNKKDKIKLVEILKHPRDAYYLPLTLKIIAQLKIKEVEDLMLKFLNPTFITKKIGSIYKDEAYDPCIQDIKRKLTLLSLDYLKYYSGDRVYEAVKKYENNKDVLIQKTAIKTKNHLENKK